MKIGSQVKIKATGEYGQIVNRIGNQWRVLKQGMRNWSNGEQFENFSENELELA